MTKRFFHAFLTVLMTVWAVQASAMFITADPMAPNQPGVGTNRYAYAGGNPVNRMDPSGYAWIDRTWDNVFGGGSFDRTFGSGSSERMDRIADRHFGNSASRATESAYSNYVGGGGNLGYDDWRFSTGNITRSFINDAFHNTAMVSKQDTNLPDLPLGVPVEGSPLMSELGAGQIVLLEGNRRYGWRHIVRRHGRYGLPTAKPNAGQFYPQYMTSRNVFALSVMAPVVEGRSNRMQVTGAGGQVVVDAGLYQPVGVASQLTGGRATSDVRFVINRLPFSRTYTVHTAYPIAPNVF